AAAEDPARRGLRRLQGDPGRRPPARRAHLLHPRVTLFAWDPGAVHGAELHRHLAGARVLQGSPAGAAPARVQPALCAGARIREVCADTTVDVKLVPDVYQYATLFGGLEEFGGLPIVNLQSTGVLGINAIAKRIFDLVFSALFLVLLSPLLAAVAILVKATSR